MGKHSKPENCPVCALPNGNHDLQKHRLVVSPNDEELEKAIRRHPAGRRRPAKDPKDA